MRIEQLVSNNQNISSKREVEKASREFEAFFIHYLLKVMRESVPKSGLLNHGISQDIYTSMMDEKIAEGIASQGGFGLSQLLERQINVNSADTDKVGSHREGEEK